ncbi:MAG: aspartate-semialdehyde dehydrogenase [Candidatus Obscuribacterales bacterium]|nr:aspartate-semialdehyde dehydrogenase [Candidatus Obscuribacterales bacterium]
MANQTNDNSPTSSVASLKNKYQAAIVGATGMVGQQLIRMLKDHPWINVKVVAASGNSAGKTYTDAVGDRWCMDFAIPDTIAKLIVMDADAIKDVAKDVDIVFCAVSASKEEVLRIEDAYAKEGAFVTSCNSAYRHDPLVPMMIPAANPEHLNILKEQRKQRGYTTGAIIVKSNCSIQSYVIALQPLRDLGLKTVRVHSEQAISGAGKTFVTWPEMVNNMIPFIGGEEQKSEIEPLKIFGEIDESGITSATTPKIKAKCVRVAVQDGHTAYVEATFEKRVPTTDEVLKRWAEFSPCTGLPSAAKQLIHYRTEPDRPQPALDVMIENGMAVTIGQLKADEDGISFTALAHNAILGAAGGAVLATELAIQKNLIHLKTLSTTR